MPVNKTGFKITTFDSLLLSCLFGNWIQSPLSSRSTSSLPAVTVNRQHIQKNVSILLILCSCFIISAQLIGLLLHFVCHFNPPLYHRRKRKISSTGGKRLIFFFLHLFTERCRRIGCHFCPMRQKPLKGVDKRREMAC